MTNATINLEALLIERAENLHDPECYQGDIAEVMLKAAEEIEGLKARVAELEGALTPTAETRAAYIGEFQFRVPMGLDEDGCETLSYINVPWTTIKEIMRAITAHAVRNRKADQ